jgi:hypothetical protein
MRERSPFPESGRSAKTTSYGRAIILRQKVIFVGAGDNPAEVEKILDEESLERTERRGEKVAVARR